jgi:hypothetical protein
MSDTTRMRGRFLLAMGLVLGGCTKDAPSASPSGAGGLPKEPSCNVCEVQCSVQKAAGPFPAPYERCAPTMEDGQGLFSVAYTDSTRATSPGTCCYLYPNRHPPGPGRPYMVSGEARVAAATPRAEWTLPLRPTVPTSWTERAARRDVWTKAALAEHASIASFARFALELLALGAPADLVHGAHAAAMDEVKHARVAFALASAYAGEPLGPGPLATADAPPRTTLEDVAVATLLEGGLGETMAAVVARMDAARADDPVVRAALLELADDEERHAELAWRTLAWAVREGGTALADVLAAEVDALLAAPSDETQGRVLRDIVHPCVTALVA